MLHPEQMDGLGYADEQSDIYSFGMTLYHMATGHHPGKKPWEDDKNYGFSRGFARVLKKCIQSGQGRPLSDSIRSETRA